MSFIGKLFFFKETLCMETDISPKDCLERLKQNTDSGQLNLAYFSKFSVIGKLVIGKFSKDKFNLSARYGSRYNYIRPFYFGKLKPNGSGTIIDGYFGIPSGTSYLSIGIALFSTLAFVFVLWKEHLGDAHWQFSKIKMFLIIFTATGVFQPKIGYYIASSQKNNILAFILKTLDAKVLEENGDSKRTNFKQSK
jgi:hypothetical protein